jgi:uncharacterized protein YndB with AHSA1/START domain
VTTGDQARVTVSVAVPPERAFAVFTEQIDLWWRRGPRFRHLRGERALIAIEPRVGGRLFESADDSDGTPAQEIGRVLVWQPPERLVFEWRNAPFATHDRTEVEVVFAPDAQGGTRITLVHRGWAALRGDHPARHGMPPAAFVRDLGLWWGALMTSLRQTAHSASLPNP